MALPGVTLAISNGNLGLQPASPERGIIYVGVCTAGSNGVLTFCGDQTALGTALGIGELFEAAAYDLGNAGGPVGVMPVTPSVRGGLSSVTHTGSGAMTMTVSAAPHVSISIACTTGGALGTAYFTFNLNSAGAGTPVASAASWGSTGYLVPGTYTTVLFTTGTYVTADVYTISTLGVIAHSAGTGPAVPTQTSSPIDAYAPTITVTTAGALATSQFTFSLDGTAGNTSAPIVTTSGGTYAIPSTGIVLTFSGTATAGDTYAFTAAGPSFSNSDLVTALGGLQTTYLSASYSMVCIVGNLASTTAWATQTASLQTIGTALFNLGVYIQFFNGCPTVGTITGSSGSVVVDSTSTDAAISTQRLTTSAPKVSTTPGDALMISSVDGIDHRRNGSWIAATRAASVEASESIGAVADGAVPGVVSIYRDEFATPALNALGFITLRTFPGNISAGTGLAGYYLTNGWTLDAVTSDYYPLANKRVIDRACGVAKAAALPLVNSKIPTKNGGVITERKAQTIEGTVNDAMLTALVNTSPQNATACSSAVDRVHNILADGLLIITIAVRPFAYAQFITVNLGLAVNL